MTDNDESSGINLCEIPLPIEIDVPRARIILEKWPWQIVGSNNPFYQEKVQILYQCEWWDLATTTLVDDVCVGRIETHYDRSDPVRPFREALNNANLGVRLRVRTMGDRIKRTFAVINAYSDG